MKKFKFRNIKNAYTEVFNMENPMIPDLWNTRYNVRRFLY